MKALVLCSGGIDSVTLAYHLNQFHKVDILNINYGQRSSYWERTCAIRCASGVSGRILWLDIPRLGHLLTSALTNPNIEIPKGEYTQESIAATIVPNRNAILADIAVGIAAAQGHPLVGLGIHAGDHPVYPDCRPEFLQAFRELVDVALDGHGPAILAPFLTWEKHQIVGLGAELGIPFEDTWSCYDGGEVQCGQCSTCTERRQAFELAGVPDPTEYAQ